MVTGLGLHPVKQPLLGGLAPRRPIPPPTCSRATASSSPGWPGQPATGLPPCLQVSSLTVGSTGMETLHPQGRVILGREACPFLPHGWVYPCGPLRHLPILWVNRSFLSPPPPHTLLIPFPIKREIPGGSAHKVGVGKEDKEPPQLSQEARKSELSSPRFSCFFAFDPHTCSRQQGFPWRPALQIKNPGSGHWRWGALNALEPCVPCRGKQAQAWT